MRISRNSGLYKGVLAGLGLFLITLSFQNCGKFELVKEANETSSASMDISDFEIPVSSVTDPGNLREAQILYINDMALNPNQLPSRGFC